MFSVLIPVYQGDNTTDFSAAMNSIFQNTLLPSKVVLVQDGPVSNDLEMVISSFVSRFSIEHVKILENRGLTYALNEGLKFIKTLYTFRADSDDINHPERFEIQLTHMIKHDLSAAGSFIKELDSNGKVSGYRTVPCEQKSIKSYAQFRSPFNHMTMAFKTQDVIDVGGYPSLLFKEDYGLWAKLIAADKALSNIPKCLVTVNAGDAMLIRRGGLNYIISEIDLFRHLKKLGLTTNIKGILVCILRSVIFGSPPQFRKIFYKLFLRKRP